MNDPNDVGPLLETVRSRLLAEFGGAFGSQRVDAALDDARGHLHDAAIVAFVPVLVEKAARERLTSELPASPRARHR